MRACVSVGVGMCVYVGVGMCVYVCVCMCVQVYISERINTIAHFCKNEIACHHTLAYTSS